MTNAWMQALKLAFFCLIFATFLLSCGSDGNTAPRIPWRQIILPVLLTVVILGIAGFLTLVFFLTRQPRHLEMMCGQNLPHPPSQLFNLVGHQIYPSAMARPDPGAQRPASLMPVYESRILTDGM